jgi:hypothetical protein
MTDIEKLAATLTEIGVPHERDDYSIQIDHPERSSSFGGYAGLFTFTEDGAFEEFRVTA